MIPEISQQQREQKARKEAGGKRREGKRGNTLSPVAAPMGAVQERSAEGNTGNNFRRKRNVPLSNYPHIQTSIPNFCAKKISESLRGGRGSHLSFALDAPGQDTPPAFGG